MSVISGSANSVKFPNNQNGKRNTFSSKAVQTLEFKTFSTDEKIHSPQDGRGFPIVGVGASAGGVEAFKQLLTYLPIDTGTENFKKDVASVFKRLDLKRL